jgi:hypothetical protein
MAHVSNTRPKVALIDGNRTDGLVVAIVGSFSTKGVKYATGYDGHQFRCTCNAAKYNPRKECKHVREFRDALKAEAN